MICNLSIYFFIIERKSIFYYLNEKSSIIFKFGIRKHYSVYIIFTIFRKAIFFNMELFNLIKLSTLIKKL